MKNPLRFQTSLRRRPLKLETIVQNSHQYAVHVTTTSDAGKEMKENHVTLGSVRREREPEGDLSVVRLPVTVATNALSLSKRNGLPLRDYTNGRAASRVFSTELS